MKTQELPPVKLHLTTNNRNSLYLSVNLNHAPDQVRRRLKDVVKIVDQWDHAGCYWEFSTEQVTRIRDILGGINGPSPVAAWRDQQTLYGIPVRVIDKG